MKDPTFFPVFMRAEFAIPIHEKWEKTCTNGTRFRAYDVGPMWMRLVDDRLRVILDPLELIHGPSEIICIHINVDEYSLLHLWHSRGGIQATTMDLGCMRSILGSLLHNWNIDPSEIDYVNEIEDFVMYLNGDRDTGDVDFEDFVAYFPLWFSSRVWLVYEKLPSNSSPVEEIIRSWSYLDISDCEAISQQTMRDVLLPYVFRVLYPKLGDVDDSILQSRWIRYMLKVVDCTRKNWINHWTIFSNMKTSNLIRCDFSDPEALTTEFLDWFNVSVGSEEEFRPHVVELQNLLTQTPSSKKAKGRAFALWIVSRTDDIVGRFLPVAIGERYVPAHPLITDIKEFHTIARNIWETYFPPFKDGLLKHRRHFETWSLRLRRATTCPFAGENFLVLRKSLCDQFITQIETETIWNRCVGKTESRIPPQTLFTLLLGVYQYMFDPKPASEGSWIVRDWMEDFTALASLIPDNRENVIITKDVFLIVFPLWYASIYPHDDEKEETKLMHVWPKSQNRRIIFSESVLRSLLTKAWDTIIPSDVGSACQDWWVERCCDKLARLSKGSGIDRTLFLSLFISETEIDHIQDYYQTINSEYLMEILSACLGISSEEIPSDILEEFFLITDVRPPRNPSEFVLPRAVFRYSFSLWAAAHYNSITV